MLGLAAPVVGQHLIHAAPQLVMLREQAGVEDVDLVLLLHLHADPTLVGCNGVLFWHQHIPVLVLHTQLEEKPGTEHKTLVLACDS